MPRIGAIGDAEKFDAIAEVGGGFDVGGRDQFNAFDGDGVGIDRRAESERRQNGKLMRRVVAADIEAGIGLRIAEALRFFEAFGKGEALGLHPAQDIIAGAVENSIDALDRVAGQSLAQRFDDRDSAGDRGFKTERDAFFFGALGERHAMLGEHRLIGGDDGFAGIERGFDRGARGRFGAADQFDEAIDLGRSGEFCRIVIPAERREIGAAFFAALFGANAGDFDPPARHGGERRGAPLQEPHDGKAHGAETGDADAQRWQHERHALKRGAEIVPLATPAA